MSQQAKALAELVIEHYQAAVKTLSPDDAKAAAIDIFEQHAGNMLFSRNRLANFVASTFGGLIGNGLTFDEALSVFRLALERIEAQEHIFRAMAKNLKDLRGHEAKS